MTQNSASAPSDVIDVNDDDDATTTSVNEPSGSGQSASNSSSGWLRKASPAKKRKASEAADDDDDHEVMVCSICYMLRSFDQTQAKKCHPKTGCILKTPCCSNPVHGHSFLTYYDGRRLTHGDRYFACHLCRRNITSYLIISIKKNINIQPTILMK